MGNGRLLFSVYASDIRSEDLKDIIGRNYSIDVIDNTLKINSEAIVVILERLAIDIKAEFLADIASEKALIKILKLTEEQVINSSIRKLLDKGLKT